MSKLGSLITIAIIIVSCGQRSNMNEQTKLLSEIIRQNSDRGDVTVMENTKLVFQAMINDTENASQLYGKMLGDGHTHVTVSEDDEMRIKQFSLRKDVGGQYLLFAIWNRKTTNTFGYFIEMAKQSQDQFWFRFNDTTGYYVCRNDTDVEYPAQLIYELFPGSPTKKVQGQTDPQVNVWVNGGKEFNLPNENDNLFKLVCRAYVNEDKGHFCKFLIKK